MYSKDGAVKEVSRIMELKGHKVNEITFLHYESLFSSSLFLSFSRVLDQYDPSSGVSDDVFSVNKI